MNLLERSAAVAVIPRPGILAIQLALMKALALTLLLLQSTLPPWDRLHLPLDVEIDLDILVLLWLLILHINNRPSLVVTKPPTRAPDLVSILNLLRPTFSQIQCSSAPVLELITS